MNATADRTAAPNSGRAPATSWTPAACGGLVLYGVLATGEDGGEPEHRTPTASVTYEVTGQSTADIT
ncbi:hypothetical protein [Streptomyces sp. NPDC002758]